jgi:hypothetical protein
MNQWREATPAAFYARITAEGPRFSSIAVKITELFVSGHT